jgi:hypothetical protein
MVDPTARGKRRKENGQSNGGCPARLDLANL